MLKLLLLAPAVLLMAYFPTPLGTPAPQQAAAAKNSSTKTSAPSSSAASASSPSPRVKQIYRNDCAMCHGDSGDGKTDLATDMKLTMSDFTDPATLQSKSDQELFDVIRKGKDKMPPEEESRAKDEEVKALVTYLRSMQKTQQAPAAAPASAPAPAPSTAPSGR